METSQRRQESLQQQPTRVGPVGERGQWAMGGWDRERERKKKKAYGRALVSDARGVGRVCSVYGRDSVRQLS